MFKHKFSMAHNPMALRYKLGSEGTAHRINHPVSMTKLFSVTSVFTRFSPNINNYTLMLRIQQVSSASLKFKWTKSRFVYLPNALHFSSHSVGYFLPHLKWIQTQD